MSRGWRWAIGIAGALVVGLGGLFLVVRTQVGDLGDFGDNTYLESAQFTPDDRLLLTTTGGQVRVWSVESGRSLETLQIDGDGGEISPRGDLFAVSRWDTKVDLWDLTSGHRVRSLSGLHADSVSFSSDGRLLLVVGRDNRARIVQVASGRLLYRFRAGDALFTPDGRFVVTTDGRRAQIRRLDTGRARLTIHSRSWGTWPGGLSPDGRLLLTLGRNRGQVWDTLSGKLLHTYRVARDIAGMRPEIYAAEFTRDAREVLIWTEGSNELWDVASGRRSANFDDSGVAALSPDGRLLATDSYSGGLQIRNLPTAAVLRVLRPGEGAPIYDMTFSPDSHLLVTTGEEDATAWDVASGRTVYVLHHDVP